EAQRARSEAIGAAGALCLCLPDLVSEHPDVQGAGRFVLVDVLAVGLIALHGITGRTPEAAPPPQANLNGLGDHITHTLATLSPTHARSSGIVDSFLHSHVTASGPPTQC